MHSFTPQLSWSVLLKAFERKRGQRIKDQKGKRKGYEEGDVCIGAYGKHLTHLHDFQMLVLS